MDHIPGLLAGTLLEHYRIDALVGRGGMGEVYRAVDSTLDRIVALKVLPPDLVDRTESIARFVQEARSASALNHPHVITIYQIGRAVPTRDGRPASAGEVQYIAMEFVAGHTLRELIDRRRLDLKRTLDYMAQVADALGAAHAAGITHRDLKPDNVMVADTGYVKVLDFGLAKLRADAMTAQATVQLTAIGTTPGAVLGTVGYMSPEQAEGKPADHRADVFAFGCVLYEAVTGTRAFDGGSSIDTLHRIIHDEPKPLSADLPAAPLELQRIVRKCLAKDPESRYQSMKEIAIDLRGLRRELDSAPAAVTPPPRAARTSRAAIVAASAAVLIVIATAATLWWARASRSAAPSEPMKIERLTGSGNVIDATVSPDGKYVAYVESFGGQQSLWVRQIAGPQPLQLVPAARVGYYGISFSNDSASVFYALKGPGFSEGRLFQLPILGGTPRALLTGIDSAVTQSPDGQHLAYLRAAFPDANASALVVSNADGSNPHPIVTRHVPEIIAPGFFVAPSWSPDGQHLSVAVHNDDTREGRLTIVDPNGRVDREFASSLGHASYTKWLPDGSGIAFVAPNIEAVGTLGGGQIWVQPYPAGEPRKITNDVIDYRNVSISNDGRSMVTVGTDVGPTLWIIPVDGKGDPEHVPSVRYDGAAGVDWMPDGRIVFSMRSGGTAQLAVMNRDGSDRRQLTVDGSSAWPQVTPDGRTIVFVGSRGPDRGLYRMNADGTAVRQIAAWQDATYLNLAPDGASVYFTSARNAIPSTYQAQIDGGMPKLVRRGLDRAAVSPDGRFLAGTLAPEEGHDLSLAILDLADGHIVRRITGLSLTTTAAAMRWAADGKSLLFTTAERTNLWRIRVDGGDAAKVTAFGDQTIFRAALSRDGRSVLAARGTQARDAFLITHFR